MGKIERSECSQEECSSNELECHLKLLIKILKCDSDQEATIIISIGNNAQASQRRVEI